jgi:hypothetical protein
MAAQRDASHFPRAERNDDAAARLHPVA